MSVVAKLARHFGRGVRHRGDDYHKMGRVVIDSGSPERVEARVKGSERYRVEINLEANTLKLYCSCPYIASMGAPCKHLWATILESDARRHMANVEKAEPLRIACRGD